MQEHKTKPLVVVQNNLVTRLTEPAALAAHVLGINLHDISSGDLTGIPRIPEYGPWGPILVMGSIVFTQQWSEGFPELSKWIFWNDSQYDASLWSDQLGVFFLNNDGYSTTMGEFIYSDSDAMHIRPRSEMKMVGDKVRTESQTGQQSIGGLVATPANIALRNIGRELAIWVSEPKQIICEGRIWMINGFPVAGSTYRLRDQRYETNDDSVIKEMMDFALKCHLNWHPDKHYVIDVALNDNNFYKVIEYNPIHSSGWYAADPKIIIEAFMLAERGNHG